MYASGRRRWHFILIMVKDFAFMKMRLKIENNSQHKATLALLRSRRLKWLENQAMNDVCVRKKTLTFYIDAVVFGWEITLTTGNIWLRMKNLFCVFLACMMIKIMKCLITYKSFLNFEVQILEICIVKVQIRFFEKAKIWRPILFLLLDV